MSRKVPLLLISRYFPPYPHIASQRASAFAKYLDPERFEVHVLTEGQARSTVQQGSVVIHSVPVRQLLPRADTFRPSPRPVHLAKAGWNRLLAACFGDADYGLRSSFGPVARKLVREQGIRVVLSSFGPRSVVELGLQLKREFPQIFWVSDLRDEIADPRLDGRMLAKADLVTSVSAPILEDLSRRASEQGAQGRVPPLLEVKNGYDFGPRREAELQRSRFRILFSGTFYGQSRPEGFFQAFDGFRKRFDLQPQDVEIAILGGSPRTGIPAAVAPFVTIREKVPYDLLPDELLAASALLLILTDHGRRGVYSGKLFDYLAVNRPILAFVNPKDVAADLVMRSGSGYVADPLDPPAMENALGQAYQEWKASRGPVRDWELIRTVHRSQQVGLLNEWLQERLFAASP